MPGPEKCVAGWAQDSDPHGLHATTGRVWAVGLWMVWKCGATRYAINAAHGMFGLFVK